MPSITINCWDLPHYYGQFFVWLRFDVHLRIIEEVYVNYKIQSMTALSHYLAHDTAWHEIRLCNTCYVTPSNWPHPSWPARLMWKWFYLWSPVQDSSYIYSEIAALPVSGSMSGVWRNTISEIYKYIILHTRHLATMKTLVNLFLTLWENHFARSNVPVLQLTSRRISQ